MSARNQIHTNINIVIDGQHIEQVTANMYIGSLISEDGRCEKEIKRRIVIARTTFTNMRTLLLCRGINLKTRLRVIKCYIWPTLLNAQYGLVPFRVLKLKIEDLWSRDMDNNYYKITVVQT